MQFLFHVLCRNCVYNRTHLLILNSKLFPELTMPKDRSFIPGLQENRIKLREKNSKYMSGHAYLQILGSGARGAPKSIYFFTDYCRYLFNCGEGTQRLAHEHKIKISRLEHIFITHPSWENIGGLPGLALTVQDVGVPDLTIHGPSGIVDAMFRATSKFIVLYNLSIKMADCCANTVYEDPAVTIHYVPLLDEQPVEQESGIVGDGKESYTDILAKVNETQDIDYYAHMKKRSSLKSSPQKSKLIPPKSMYTRAVMCYICKLKPKIGKLSLEACVEKGVPPGPFLGKLKNGEDVVLPDGTLVKSTDVKEPDSPGPVFIIVECPSINYLENLLSEEKFKQHQIGAVNENLAQYVFHFTPSDIVKHEKYQTWMARFPSTTNHVYVNDSNTCMGNVGVHILQRQLNYLDSTIFPLLKDQSIPIVDVPMHKKQSMKIEDIFERGIQRVSSPTLTNSEYPVHASQLNISPHVGHTLKFINLRPRKTDESIPTCVCMNPTSIIEDLYKMDNFQTEYETLKSKLSDISYKVNADNEKQPFPIVTFLGTGSSIPNKSRNTSGILITFSDNNHMIMDCGEGTYGQLVRHFGIEEADRILVSVRAIYVSHLHADHHIGSINLLKRRREAVKKLNADQKKVYFLAPEQIIVWFYSYHLQFEPIMDCLELVPNQDLVNNNPKTPRLESLLQALDLLDIKTTNVRHCPHSFGITVVDLNHRKITYSGDTMPTDALVKIGMNSDLLIHEATFEDELSNEARLKMHSTSSEAIAIGKKMNAKFTILTHFSQRYYKIPVITEHFDETVGVAFDNMRIRLGDLQKLPLFNNILKIVFSEERELMEFKSFKRKRKLDQ